MPCSLFRNCWAWRVVMLQLYSGSHYQHFRECPNPWPLSSLYLGSVQAFHWGLLMLRCFFAPHVAECSRAARPWAKYINFKMSKSMNQKACIYISYVGRLMENIDKAATWIDRATDKLIGREIERDMRALKRWSDSIPSQTSLHECLHACMHVCKGSLHLHMYTCMSRYTHTQIRSMHSCTRTRARVEASCDISEVFEIAAISRKCGTMTCAMFNHRLPMQHILVVMRKGEGYQKSLSAGSSVHVAPGFSKSSPQILQQPQDPWP